MISGRQAGRQAGGDKHDAIISGGKVLPQVEQCLDCDAFPHRIGLSALRGELQISWRLWNVVVERQKARSELRA